MKIVLAFDSFKQTMSSKEVGETVKQALLEENPDLDITCLEIADGGEGSVDAIVDGISGEKQFKTILGPHFDKIDACIGRKGNDFYIESASVVGFKYKKENDTPSNISTFGIGELIKYALDENARNIYICLGGTTSNDGGCGMACALGAKFYDSKKNEFTPIGTSLNNIADIDISGLDKRLFNTNIIALCDVVNPLYGKNGASYVYAFQKGADEKEVESLDKGLIKLDKIMKEKYNIDNANVSGAGAAGGLGYGIISFLKGNIKKGIDTILDIINFDEIIKDCTYIFTGEGRLDSQSFQGKVLNGITDRAQKQNKNVICVFGTISKEEIKLPKCICKVYKTNIFDLPFEEIKLHAKEDLFEVIKSIEL